LHKVFSEPQHMKLLNILYAEDSKADQVLFDHMLKETGIPCQLQIADNGEALINLLPGLQSKPPDVILLDINMPGYNGFECLKEIRQNHSMDGVLTAMFSNTTQPDDIEKAYRLKANLYIKKPAGYEHGIILLRHFLNSDWSCYFPQSPKELFEYYAGEFVRAKH
jgi:CheY-like chemotaxis protein